MPSLDLHCSSTVWALLGKGAVAANALVLLLLGAYFLSPEQQGVFLTIQSLIAFQVIFEMGSGYAISQVLAHEFAKLKIDPDDRIALGKIGSLLRFILKWNSVAALTFLMMMPWGGFHLFHGKNYVDLSSREIVWIWVFTVFIVSVNIGVNGVFSFLEASGKVLAVWRIRTAMATVTLCATTLSLFSGAQVFSLPIGLGCAILVGGSWIFFWCLPTIKKYWQVSSATSGFYRLEVFPFQWRVALSWLSGYLSFQLTTPILFWSLGAAQAGRFAFTYQLVSGLGNLASAWFSAQYVQLSKNLVLNGKESFLKQYKKLCRQSTVFLLVIFFLFYAIAQLLYLLDFSAWSQRSIGNYALFLIAASVLCNHFSSLIASLFRVHKKEPFFIISVVSGLASVFSAIVIVPRAGIDGAALSHFMISFLIGVLGGCIVLFLNKDLLKK